MVAPDDVKETIMKTEGMNTELTLDELNDVWGGGAWADLVNNPVAQTAAVTIMQVATVTPFGLPSG